MRKRIMAILLCICMVAVLLPTTAFAAGTSAIQLGADSIAKGDKVYFGQYGEEEVPWIALDDDGFLLSQYTIGSVRFRDCRYYYQPSGPQNPGYYGEDWDYVAGDSQLKLTMDGLYNGEETTLFTTPEQGAVAATALTPESMDYVGDVRPLTVHLYPLSVMEIYDYSAKEYIIDEALLVTGDITDKLDGNEYGWWTRTNEYDTGAVRVGGRDNASPSTDDICNSAAIRGVRPAFNLNMDSVLFTSAAVGGKTSDGTLAAVDTNATGNWKLTLSDSSRSEFSITTTALSSASATVKYAGAKTGTNEYISAMIVDSGSVTYYGRIMQLDGTTNGTSGTVIISIPSSVTLDADTTLRVFNEQFNGDKSATDDTLMAYTDYASDLKIVTAPIIPSASIGSATVSGTTGTAITPVDVTISLTNEQFNELAADADVSSWFTNLPAGLSAKIKTAVAASATVTFTGTPTAISTTAMTVTIPAASLVGNADLAVTSNTNAKWAITSPTPPGPGSGSDSMQYQITQGQYGEWTQGGTDGLRFTANADYGKFMNVSVDGSTISSDKYTVQSGSTIVTLKASYLETLTVGRHILRVNFTDGYAETYFNVNGYSNIPKTGDNAQPVLWLGITLTAGTGLVAALVVRRKQKNG